ncbi:TPA: hypothetical protein DEG21_04170 [Patescibacteria group bacterium]|nr:hypothetical protein [Candidatus Gracilibacteria bacterium]
MTTLRLQKYLSQAGICSRRKAEEYIGAGLVLVNGKKATIGQSVDDELDKITLKNEEIKLIQTNVYYKLNKPY